MKELIVSPIYNAKGNIVGQEYHGELIRCKDCKHWTVTCDDDYQSCECDALIRHKDFYCARAERKDNGKTD